MFPEHFFWSCKQQKWTLKNLACESVHFSSLFENGCFLRLWKTVRLNSFQKPSFQSGRFPFRKKNPEKSVGATVEFPIGKKLFHLVVSPGTSRLKRANSGKSVSPEKLQGLYSVNMNLWTNLLDTYQLIQGQGTRGAKVPPLWGQQENKPRIDTWAQGKPLCLANCWPWQIFLPWTWNWSKLRERCQWNTKFRSEIPTGKTGPPF